MSVELAPQFLLFKIPGMFTDTHKTKSGVESVVGTASEAPVAQLFSKEMNPKQI